MNILSLFDGMSCGRIALERAGIKIGTYYASEINKHAIKVSKDNYPDIIHIGDVTKVSYKNGVLSTEVGEFEVNIDLVIGGSPCQGFSMAGKQLAFDDPRSSLYFKFEEILKQVNPKYFLLENVKMKQEHKDVISERLGVQSIAINSSLVSAQNRYRLYWTNIPNVTQPEDKGILLKDILQENVDESYYCNQFQDKTYKVRRNYLQYDFNGKNNNSQSQRVYSNLSKVGCLDTAVIPKVFDSSLVRKLTPQECEQLQTVPIDYTKCVTDGQRYKMLGNGWTVDVIAHIFKNMEEYK